jgi:tetratricopeptide (TPR) repeat protein
MRFAATFLTASLLLARPVAAQHEHHHDDHSHDLGNIGKVTFVTSCNEAAQREISRGAALIHSFWYVEAENSFRNAAKADPACGMAWWGVAMSNYHPIWQPPTPAELKTGVEAALKAKELGAKTERERGYIDAINAFYADAGSVPHGDRAAAFERAMQRVATSNADDNEASIFYALAMLGTASPTDKTYANQKKAAEVLTRILPLEKEHPGVAHYIIHSFDYAELAALALPAARTYAKLAPGSPHALHMPSHIFTRLGLWEESIASNEDSRKKASDYVKAKDPQMTSFDELHAIDYLVYAYLQLGRDAEAKKHLDTAATIKKLDNPLFQAAFAIAAVPARYALERRNWKEAAALTVPKTISFEKFAYCEANIHFARAIGGARSGNLAVARDAVAQLEALHRKLVEQKSTYWAGQVEIQHHAAASWLSHAEGKDEEALRLAMTAAELESKTEKHPVTPGAIIPARELLAELLLETGRAADALAEINRELTASPNRKNALALRARAQTQAAALRK